MKPRAAVSLGLALSIVVLGAASDSAAQLAPFVTVYEGSASVEIAGRIAEFVRKQLGVELRFEALSHGVIHSRIKAEAPRFGADMIINAGFPLLQEAKKQGWSVPYKSPAWAGAGSEWADPDGHWWINSRWNFVLVGNKGRLAQLGYEMPRTWDDLLDPKWRKQIVMPSPATSGTAFLVVYSFITEYGFNRGKGEEGGWKFLEALNQNVDHYTRGGNTPTDLVARGEFLLGIASDEIVLPRLKEGYPLLVGMPAPGIGFGMQGMSILAGTRKLETVQKIVDLLGTKEFSQFLADTAGYVTRFPDAVPALYRDAPPRYIPNINVGWALAERERLLAEWMRRIGRVPAK